MKYKALMMDVDGTLSKYSTTDMPMAPSNAVVHSVDEAKKSLFVGLATSRPLSKVKEIFRLLKLNGYSILHNGAQIIDSSLDTIWTRAIETESLKQLFEISSKYNIQTFFSDFSTNKPLEDVDDLLSIPISDIFFDGVRKSQYEAIIKDLIEVPNIFVHRLSSRWADRYELSITHKEATKEIAIIEVANLLRITTDEIIGVGDAHNDLPLLQACGFKVAMGNAVEELKHIADYITPSVDEDGVAKFITDFIVSADGEDPQL